ncbi:TPA: hypothetical protein I8608_003244 [Morganella morganii]|uniref:Cell invasion protein SipD n=1 Tax=Morganella morganii TaxID=582 RepID=A0AAN5MHX0_MORMO|nr:hypothetical protein [Morganella morganii]
MNINNYYTIASGIFGTENKSGQDEYIKSGAGSDDISNIIFDEVILELYYSELCNINLALSDPLITEEQALKELNEYNKIIRTPGVKAFISTTKNELSDKIKDIDESIQYYFLKKEMVTFGYFVDRMDIASKYSHDIGVKNYRDGLSQYTDFYKRVTGLLSSYGEYNKGVIDDGKKTKFKQILFYYDLHNELMRYYPVTGDLKNDKGKDCSIYKSKFEIDISNGMNNCSVYIDDKLIDSGVSYDDAFKKMEYFFSVTKYPVSGTRIIKKINAEKNSIANVDKITGMIDVIVMPEALLQWLEIPVNKEDYEAIDSFFDNSINILRYYNGADNGDYSAVAKLYENALRKTREISNKGLEGSYYTKTASLKKDEIWHLDQGSISSYNTKIDGIKKELQMTIDEFSQRYNTINSNYDNMLRVITTMISELTQELKGFLRI